jgi:hypothetical protein
VTTSSVARVVATGQRGAALVIAILALAILTVIGIALMLVTSTESKIAANEWSLNRAFYAADAGVRWARVQLNDPGTFLTRPEFRNPPAPFGTVLFQMPSHRHGLSSLFSGDPEDDDIQVAVSNPGMLGRRPFPGGIINEQGGRAQFVYGFEVRTNGSQSTALLQYAKALVADVEVGPLPAQLPF